jgi:hypothetical protein
MVIRLALSMRLSTRNNEAIMFHSENKKGAQSPFLSMHTFSVHFLLTLPQRISSLTVEVVQVFCFYHINSVM